MSGDSGHGRAGRLMPGVLVARSIFSWGNCKNKMHDWVVATQILFIFTPNPGEMIQFDVHIFQMGWFNHQLDEQIGCKEIVSTENMRKKVLYFFQIFSKRF